jgi:hypothetical protein
VRRAAASLRVWQADTWRGDSVPGGVARWQDARLGQAGPLAFSGAQGTGDSGGGWQFPQRVALRDLCASLLNGLEIHGFSQGRSDRERGYFCERAGDSYGSLGGQLPDAAYLMGLLNISKAIVSSDAFPFMVYPGSIE